MNITNSIAKHSLLLFVFFSRAASALDGKVVSVADGDTLTVLDVHNVEHRIRLAQIDAPEKNQPWGQKSKQSLSFFAAGKNVFVDVQAVDRYGRAIGNVFVQNQSASTYQLNNGMAWVYDKYVKDHALYDIQKAAKSGGVGLWQDANPVAPWQWRKQGRRAP